MTSLHRRIAAALVATLALGHVVASAQRRPDISGDWVLVEALAAGPGRNPGDGAAEGPRRTSSTTISGAVFNCGTGCTIAQKGQTLSVGNAQLADYPGKDKSKPTPPVTLHLDGREAEVLDTFSPPRKVPATARWDANKVRIDSGGVQSAGYSQVLSLDAGQLIVVTASKRSGEAGSEVIYKYRRK